MNANRLRVLQVAAIAVASLSVAAAPAAAASAPALGPEVKVSLSTVDSQSLPQAVVFPDGGFLVAWNAQGKPGTPAAKHRVVHARSFAADASPVSGEFLLDLGGIAPVLDGLAPIGNNRFVVAWDDYGQPNTRVMLQIFNRASKAVSAPLQVHANSQQSRYFGVVATNSAGDIAVAWSADLVQGLNYRNDAYARVFSKTLMPLSGELFAAEGSFSDGSGPFTDAIRLAPDGSMAIAFTYAGDGVDVFAARFDRDGNRLPMDYLYPANTCCIPNTYDSSLAMAADGSFLITWDYARPQPGEPLPAALPPWPINGRLFAADGTAQGEAVINVNRRSYGVLTSPVTAALPAGGWLTAWEDQASRDGGGTGIFGRLQAADGTPQGLDFQIDRTAAGNQAQPAIAGGPGGAIVVWISGSTGTVYARRVNAADI